MPGSAPRAPTHEARVHPLLMISKLYFKMKAGGGLAGKNTGKGRRQGRGEGEGKLSRASYYEIIKEEIKTFKRK